LSIQSQSMGTCVADVPSLTRFRMGSEEFAVLSVPVGSSHALAALTPSERSVVQAVLAGRSNNEIAEARATAPRTVANQLAAIYRKLGISSRAELALWCSAPTRPGPVK
jgi:DNA-binding NarL/FixJ family response regulator